ncbi:MAG: hypothetical protein ABI672_15235 [Vicinamibacteria bacterium]
MERNQKGVVIGLTGALAAALLVIAFLLGRITARPVADPTAAAAPPTSQTMPVASVAESSGGSLASPVDQSAMGPSTTAGISTQVHPDGPAGPFGGTIPTPPVNLPPPSLGGSREAQEIAAYFSVLDRIEEVGAGDPQSFATSLMQSVSSGDFSGFDDLVNKARAQRERLGLLKPPKACADHHRIAMGLSNDSVAMLEKLRAALAKGDTTALLSMTTEGQTLEAKAKQLKAMGDAIKRQAGLPTS